MSHDDVIESADAAQPLTQRLADASVGHVTGELAQAGIEHRLESQEGRVRQEEDLVQESQHHVGPRLQRERQHVQHKHKHMAGLNSRGPSSSGKKKIKKIKKDKK